MRLSIPHNGDPALPKLLMGSEFRDAISEVYFSGNPAYVPSGRRPKLKYNIRLKKSGYSFDKRSYDRDLCNLIDYFNSHSVRCNLLLNFDGYLTPKMVKYVDSLINAGVTVVTVGSISILTQIINRYGKSVRVQNSVYLPVNNLRGVDELLDLGINTFLVPPDFNHDRAFLSKVYSLLTLRHCELKLMVNEGCVKHCQHRKNDLHDAQTYPIQKAVNDYVHNPFESRRLSNPCRWYLQRNGISRTNYIHPKDISSYFDFKPLIKVVGRSFSSEIIFNICRAYYCGQYNGDLRMLVENFKHATKPVIHGHHCRAIFT